MTTPRDVDELASALIDGLLPADEAAAARRDPAVAARVAQMQAARDALRRSPSIDAGERDRTIAAVLGHLGVDDRGGAGQEDDAVNDPHRAGATPAGGRLPSVPPPGPPGGPTAVRTPGPTDRRVVALSRSTVGAPRGARWGRWLGAAATVAALAAVGGAVLSQGGREVNSDVAAEEPAPSPRTPGGDAGAYDADEDVADSPAAAESGSGAVPRTSSPGAAAAGPPDAAVDNGAGGDVPASPAPAPGEVVDLGPVASGDALIVAARNAAGDRGAASPFSESRRAATGCPDPLGSSPAPPALLLLARATLDGMPVDVWVFDHGGEPRVVATDVTCSVIVDSGDS